MTDTLTLTRPDDWHVHLRDGVALTHTVPATARQFGRAIVMPNLKPPVTTVEAARAYRARILAACPVGIDFDPLMTLYLTDETRPDEIARAAASDVVHAVKLYPAGATTNSAAGVTDIRRVDGALEAMAEAGLPLLLHGEVTHADIDIFDREAAFLGEVLAPLIARSPRLRIVLEHITTRAAVDFVRANPRLGATITAHHLLANRNDMLVGGVRPHYFCLPILKREDDRQALLAAATSGSPQFFLGTDSAPHAVGAKESPCGCAGCFTAHAALELYAEAFESAGALDRLEGFASHHGPDFYGLARNTETVTLRRASWRVEQAVPFGEAQVRPFRADAPLIWRLG